MLPRTRSSITGLAAQIRLILASHAPAAGSGGAAADRHAFRETRSGRPGRSSRGSRVAHQPEDHCESAIDRAILREVCRRVHSAAGVTRLQDCADYVVSREINQTIYRAFITDRSSCTRLFKGVEIGRYRARTQLSQGVREWFDDRAFLKKHGAKPAVAKRRIATQRITGVDERWLVVATIIDPRTYFADSTNSIALGDSARLSLEYLLGLLNCRLVQWRFKLTSTNNNVGTNELNALPVRNMDLRAKSDNKSLLSRRDSARATPAPSGRPQGRAHQGKTLTRDEMSYIMGYTKNLQREVRGDH